jgi:hypothetical protein
MYKDNACTDIFLAVVILVFSFWKIPISMWIIVIAGSLLLIKGIVSLIEEGGNCFGMRCGPFEHRVGSELFMEKSKPIEPKPSKEEVKEVLGKENSSKKKSNKSFAKKKSSQVKK